MFPLTYKDFVEIATTKDLPLEMKVHIFESAVSELVYRFWCRMTGGKFERRPMTNRNKCLLVTKRAFHPISSFIAKRKSSSIDSTSSYLEVYERNCPGNKWGTTSTLFRYRWSDNSYGCPDCGKPCEMQDDDKKIVGKFYRS